MHDLLAAIRRTIAERKMITPGDTVVVAVSGGADSVALLHALWSLKSELGIELVAAHLHHGIRGAEADADALFAGKLAAELGVPFVTEKIDIPKLREEQRMGIEEAARIARYGFLERVAEETGSARIATAHTSDDQAETVLLNIIRGTGPEGLSGMPPVRGKVIRPLIEVSRTAVESYLREVGLKWRTDSSNLEAEYTRNKVRLELIPSLERQFNPRVKDSITSLSRLVADENDYVRSAADEAYQRAVRRELPDSVELDSTLVRKQPRAIKRRIIRAAIERVKGDLRDLEFHQVERIRHHLDAEEPITLTLPSGKLYAQVTRDTLRIFGTREVVTLDIRYPLSVPESLYIPELDGTVESKFVEPTTRPDSPNQAIIDPAQLAGSLYVRTWQEGDRIKPLGMTGHKKLQDIFTDHKVPRPKRGMIPVITDEEKIVWIAGISISDEVKITRDSRSAALIEWSSALLTDPSTALE